VFRFFQKKSTIPTKPLIPPEPIEQRDFSLSELSKYNGQDGAKIYIAVKNKVFDVSVF